MSAQCQELQQLKTAALNSLNDQFTNSVVYNLGKLPSEETEGTEVVVGAMKTMFCGRSASLP